MSQQEYEQSQPIDAPPEEVFAWLSDVGNLPKYLPPVVDSSVEGASAEGVPGQRIRTTLKYPGEGGGTFDAEGYLSVNEKERRMEWGRRRSVTTRDGLRSRITAKGPARWWCTSPLGSARSSRRSRNVHPRAATP